MLAREKAVWWPPAPGVSNRMSSVPLLAPLPGRSSSAFMAAEKSGDSWGWWCSRGGGGREVSRGGETDRGRRLGGLRSRGRLAADRWPGNPKGLKGKWSGPPREVGSRVVVLHVVVQSVLGLEQLTTLRALKHMDIIYIFSRNMNFY